MGIADIGPRPQAFDLETETLENPNYRTVAWSGKHLQVTLMSIPANGDIGLEKHGDTDQFIRLDRGRGRAQMGPAKDELTFDEEVTDGWCVIVPAGSWHNITNIGEGSMQVYTIYAPQHHEPGQGAPDEGDRRRRHRRRTRRLVGSTRPGRRPARLASRERRPRARPGLCAGDGLEALMATIVSTLFISLDGVVEIDPAWHFPYFDENMGAAVGEDYEDVDVLLLGRVTYDSFAGAWPDRETAGGEDADLRRRSWVTSARSSPPAAPGPRLAQRRGRRG